MKTLAFVLLCLAWSFSWVLSKLQVNSFVPCEISLFYRFGLVSILLLPICLALKSRLNCNKSELKFFCGIGLTNFCINNVLGYYGAKYTASGVVAVVFSLTIITSEIFKSWFDGKKIEPKVIFSGLLGFVGLGFFVIPTLKFGGKENFGSNIAGILFATCATIIFSIGNYLVEKNRRQNQTPLFTLLFYCCLIGSFYLLVLNLILGNKFEFDSSFAYVSSLAYMVFFASILAFGCLFYLVQTIGAVRANYTALIYPSIALLISSIYEDFHFTIIGFIGLAMIVSALAIEFLWKKT